MIYRQNLYYLIIKSLLWWKEVIAFSSKFDVLGERMFLVQLSQSTL